MLELIAWFFGVVALSKALRRWATPLVARHRPRALIDPGSVGFHAAGPSGVDDAGGS